MPLLNFGAPSIPGTTPGVNPYAGLLGDTLTGLGIGLLSQQASPYPISPLAGISQGLTVSNQLQGQRRDRAADQVRMQLAQSQFGLQQQQAQRAQTEWEEQQRQHQAAARAAASMFGGSLPGPDGGGAPSQPNPAFANMDPERLAFLQQYAAGNPEGALSLGAEQVFATEDAPKTNGGMQYNTATHSWEPIPGYTEQAAAIAAAGRTPPQPRETFRVVTGKDAQAMGLDPNARYQVGSFGGVSMIGNAPAAGWSDIPDQSGRIIGQRNTATGEIKYFGTVPGADQYGETITGEQAKALGLNPAGTYQRGPDGKWALVPSPDAKVTWQTVTDASGKPLYQESSIGERKALPGNESGGAFKQENTLRDEYNTLTKDFRTVQDAYNKIQSTSNTGAGDMSLLYSYVKLLDPGSVVRESEFATAAASGSFGQQVQGAVSRVMSGERLPDSLRQSFKSEATRIYEGQKVAYDNAGKSYTELARKAGIDPTAVVIPYATQAPTTAPQMQGNGPDVYQEFGLVPPPNYQNRGPL